MSVLDLFAGVGLLVKLLALVVVWPLWILGALGRLVSDKDLDWDPYKFEVVHFACAVSWFFIGLAMWTVLR